MTPEALGLRIVHGSFAGLCAFGALGYGLLQAGLSVPEWTVSLAFALGLAVAWWGPGRTAIPATRGAPAPRWLVICSTLVIATLLIALVHGSLATPARHWDGAVSWEVRANFLTWSPTIEQPFFRDPAVYSHSRDYPLLQPLLVAAGNRLLGHGGGRLLFPALFLLLLATVGVALRRWGSGGRLAWLGTLAVACTPMIVNPTSGGVDSGYAELFLAVALAGTAAGLLLEDRLLLFLGPFLAVLVKPEGLVYGAFPAIILWCGAARALLRPAVLGWLASAAIWLPLQHGLQHFGSESARGVFLVGLLIVGCIVLGSDELLHRVGARIRTRTWLAVCTAPAILLALPLMIVAAGNPGGTLDLYLSACPELLSRIPDLLPIAASFIRYAFLHLGFGLTFWLLAVAGAAASRRWRPGSHTGTVAFLVLGLLSVVGPFLLSPEPELQHHLRSSMSRLQLHWLGVAWVVVLVLVRVLESRRPAEEPEADLGISTDGG